MTQTPCVEITYDSDHRDFSPIAVLLIAEYVQPDVRVILQEKPSHALEVKRYTESASNTTDYPIFYTATAASRYLARLCLSKDLYGETILQKTEVDHWLTFSQTKLACPSEVTQAIWYLDRVLSSATYLVGYSITIADILVWSNLYVCDIWNSVKESAKPPKNLLRWYNHLSSLDIFVSVINKFPVSSSKETNMVRNEAKAVISKISKEEGKFIDLPGAKMGEVVVRFPPEASGYLHVGHAKAALLNQYYQLAFNGKLVMRFDDTNPDKEKEDFEKVILEDLKMLEVKPDVFTYTSDHFDAILQKCEDLLKQGKAYVDDTDPEQMKAEREQRKESKNRNNSVEKNLQMWEEMKKGTDYGVTCCVRAKMDMNSDNGCMRDATMYRCKKQHHPRTGNKYNAYPTYDFSCPIVDSVEGVTHALRTTEYHDRDPQYFWFIDALNLRKPYIYEYSRLNMMNTVLSKRKLTWFVENKIVDGWDDPRMPTVRGVLRKGMTVEGLKQFIIAQGSSRSVVVMDWDKIWSFNRKVIDPIAPRYNAVEKEDAVPVCVLGATEGTLSVQKHPKNPALGNKTTWVGPNVIIDSADAACLKVGEIVTFINWGNMIIKDINCDSNGKICNVTAELNLENKDFKKTLKITWLADVEKAPPVSCACVYYDHIISKPVLDKDEDFKNSVGENTKIVVEMLGDPEIANLKKSDIIQIQRKGFFICDQPYDEFSVRHTGRISPAILISIPDGTKDTATLPAKVQEFRKLKEESGKECKPGEVKEKGSPKAVSSEVDVLKLDAEITEQGNRIRELKNSKVGKETLDPEIQKLLKLKENFKAASGKEWKPGEVKKEVNTPKSSVVAGTDITKLDAEITEQGNKIRELKSSKVAKEILDQEIQKLLKLKASFKAASGKEWKPGEANKEGSPPKSSVVAGTDIVKLDAEIKEQGNKIRDLKSSKVAKEILDQEIQKLLKLKADFKAASGKEWKPDVAKNEVSPPKSMAGDADILKFDTEITEQGNKIRELKNSKAGKETLDPEIQKLLKLKADYKAVTGKDWKPAQESGCGKPDSVHNAKKPKKSQGEGNEKKKGKSPVKEMKNNITDVKDQGVGGQSGIKKITRLGLEVTKEDCLSEWYSQIITKAELIEYYDISGCYILRPWAYNIWESIKDFFDSRIKSIGVQNCYFPMFVSGQALEKEKTHISDFAPEVAWVTKSGNTDLAEPIAIRPTSETVMYPTYAKWIKSHRDLPLLLNQWCNVVRWEFKHPQPFLRTREFLWQEGHTAYATKEEAEKEVYVILDFYAEVYEKLLAIPVIKGKKTEKEKFAGGDFTTTCEIYVSASGRAIQGATSHHLGQNFSKMFEIVFEDPETSEKKYVYQNSWGLTTRTIGVMVMVHGDNNGLVLPPQVACFQVIVVPCGINVNLSESDKDNLIDACTNFEKLLCSANIRCKGDYRDNYSPGWKFNHWELKGVPIRVELGPRDVKHGEFVAVRRDTGEKIVKKICNAVVELRNLLEMIQDNLYQRASVKTKEHLGISHDWNDFCQLLDKNFLIQAPFCGDIPCEDAIKNDSSREEQSDMGAPSMGAKSLCIPFQQPGNITADMKCIHPACKKKPLYYTLFGRSY